MAEEDTGRVEKTESEKLSELELALTVLWNSVRRWMTQRSKDSFVTGMSDLDSFLLHFLVYRNRELRASDLAFALSIDDMHLVHYSLKKLGRLGSVATKKRGKEVFYGATEQGVSHYREFLRDRKTYLEPALHYITHEDYDLAQQTKFVRALSSVYEQAARSAATSMGIIEPLDHDTAPNSKKR